MLILLIQFYNTLFTEIFITLHSSGFYLVYHVYNSIELFLDISFESEDLEPVYSFCWLEEDSHQGSATCHAEHNLMNHNILVSIQHMW